MKIVLDTNLLVAYFFNKESASAKIMNLIKKRKLKNLWSTSIKKEAKLILSQIPVIPKSYYQEMEKIVFKPNNKIKSPPKIKVIKEDPEDNKLLSCALKGKADYLISNDHHLLKQDRYRKMRVMTPKDFISFLGKGS